MSLFVEFEGSYCTRYSLALHVAYHMEQYKVMAEHEGWAAQAHVPEALLAEYEAVIALLRERNHEAHSDIKTERRKGRDGRNRSATACCRCSFSFSAAV